MDIAVNARFLLPGRLEGIGTFSHEVLRRLVRDHPEHTFHFLFDRPFDEALRYGPNVVPHVLLPPARHPLLFVVWFEGRVAAWLRRNRPALFFSPDGYLSLGAPRSLPQVIVMHDLAFRHFPEMIGPLEAWHYNHFFPRFARRAAHILTVSAFTRADVQAQFGEPAAKLRVVGNGAKSGFSPLPAAEQQAVREAWSDGCPYFLYVGALQPRKNIVRLLRAFDRYKAATGDPTKLLLTGRLAWKTGPIRTAYEQMTHRSGVVFTGFVDETVLGALYGSALALTYVSLFEGFGLPLLEAFHAEVPVLTSDRSSMPEVAGEAALLVDPTDEAAIAEGLRRLAAEPDLRRRLVEAGRVRREQYTWEKTAAATWAGLAPLLEGSPAHRPVRSPPNA